MPSDAPALAVVIVTHDSAASLPQTLATLVPQLGEDDELLVVDNASRDGTPALVREHTSRARIIETGANLGFAGACNVGVEASAAPLVLLLNPDAHPAHGCLDALRAAATTHPDWGAWQALVTLPGGTQVNTSGGVTHYLGFSWAGGCGQSVMAGEDREVAFASGAALVVRREAWEHVGGFDPAYFMYVEDVDLSLRLRLAGYGVGIAPAAVVEHDYDFDKGAYKWLLLERNRWRTILADYPTPLLLALLPALLAFELALLPVAARGGWLREKLRAHAAVLRALPALLRRRARVQRTSRVSAAVFAGALTARLDSPYLPIGDGLAPLVAVQRGYWAIVERLLGGSRA
ncbi:MAG TPA: glycosyltransferase family 2 protein [Conexibacter sp.]|nr:glycosyltransferase family 2 protein [Conexibacter sp.]